MLMGDLAQFRPRAVQLPWQADVGFLPCSWNVIQYMSVTSVVMFMVEPDGQEETPSIIGDHRGITAVVRGVTSCSSQTHAILALQLS